MSLLWRQFDSKVLLGSQKMRTHVTMVFAWSEPTVWYLYCAQTMSKYLSVKYLLISKKVDIKNYLEPFKKLIFGVRLGGPQGRWHPQTMSKYLSVEYLLMSKRTSTLAWAVQKMDFLGPHFGGVPGGVAQKNFGRNNCVCSSTTLHKN